MTDPRVVQNNTGVTPWLVPGARASCAMSRVLNPSTPLSEVVDPFGETVKPKLRPLAPLPDKFVDHAIAVLNISADSYVGQAKVRRSRRTSHVKGLGCCYSSWQDTACLNACAHARKRARARLRACLEADLVKLPRVGT